VTLSDNLLKAKAAVTPGKLDVFADEKCKWSVSDIPPWIGLNLPSELNGNRQLTFSIAQNTGPAREGAFGVGGYWYWVKQEEGCGYQLEPRRKSFNANGGQERLQIKTASGCQWTASNEQDWIKIRTGATGQGDGVVAYTVNQNRGVAREGLIKIGAATFKIEQQAAAQSPKRRRQQKPEKAAKPGKTAKPEKEN
jgi:hypothetical protein